MTDSAAPDSAAAGADPATRDPSAADGAAPDLTALSDAEFHRRWHALRAEPASEKRDAEKARFRAEHRRRTAAPTVLPAQSRPSRAVRWLASCVCYLGGAIIVIATYTLVQRLVYGFSPWRADAWAHVSALFLADRLRFDRAWTIGWLGSHPAAIAWLVWLVLARTPRRLAATVERWIQPASEPERPTLRHGAPEAPPFVTTTDENRACLPPLDSDQVDREFDQKTKALATAVKSDFDRILADNPELAEQLKDTDASLLKEAIDAYIEPASDALIKDCSNSAEQAQRDPALRDAGVPGSAGSTGGRPSLPSPQRDAGVPASSLQRDSGTPESSLGVPASSAARPSWAATVQHRLEALGWTCWPGCRFPVDTGVHAHYPLVAVSTLDGRSRVLLVDLVSPRAPSVQPVALDVGVVAIDQHTAAIETLQLTLTQASTDETGGAETPVVAVLVCVEPPGFFEEDLAQAWIPVWDAAGVLVVSDRPNSCLVAIEAMVPPVEAAPPHVTAILSQWVKIDGS